MERASQNRTVREPPSRSNGREVRIHILGPMSVIAKGCQDLTPRSRKACALLALLALAPRGQRTRVWLRDKLWSCSDEKKSSTSLRQIVFELKRDLGEWASQVLVIDRQTIGLDLNSVWVDVREIERNPYLFHDLKLGAETQLLEGLDIADEEFEEWLQMERRIWFDRASDLAEQSRTTPATAVLTMGKPIRDARREKDRVLRLGFLPSIQHGCTEQLQHLADDILEGIANNLRALGPIKICDFRDDMISGDFLPNACETDYYARVRILQLRHTISITFFLYKANRMGLEWSQSIQAPVNEFELDEQGLVPGFISQAVDRLAKSLFAVPAKPQLDLENVDGVSFLALNMMLPFDESALENSETLLLSAHEASANPYIQLFNRICCRSRVAKTWVISISRQ